MKRILTTQHFDRWFKELKDKRVRARVNTRLRRLEQGHYGDFKALGDGVSELRLLFGAGYRIYYTEQNAKIVILLCGGDKSTQAKDIARAKILCSELEE